MRTSSPLVCPIYEIEIERNPAGKPRFDAARLGYADTFTVWRFPVCFMERGAKVCKKQGKPPVEIFPLLKTEQMSKIMN